tara:strand:+ start:949 stop:1575 length:627 start_codon:yes stop_codon:yes gene_type:complete
MALVKYNNNSISDVTALAGIPSGAMTLIKTITTSSDATVSFVNGSSDVVLDGTYPIYLFKYIQLHPSTDSAQLQFNLSADTGSNYNVTKTSTQFKAYNKEDGSANALVSEMGDGLVQSTSAEKLSSVIDNDNDACYDGMLFLFNPSSTTFVKHYLATGASLGASVFHYNDFTGGYANTTSAVDAIQFSLDDGGDFDSGTFKMYGIKDS